ncbi:MAG: hypothetical protein ACPG8N_03765 [Rhodothermales bacterium]
MAIRTLDSLSLKIHSFLRQVGVKTDPGSSDAAALVAYFEREYGLSLMSFLESEWLREELERDDVSDDFQYARDILEPERRKAFDADMSLLLSR